MGSDSRTSVRPILPTWATHKAIQLCLLHNHCFFGMTFDKAVEALRMQRPWPHQPASAASIGTELLLSLFSFKRFLNQSRLCSRSLQEPR